MGNAHVGGNSDCTVINSEGRKYFVPTEHDGWLLSSPCFHLQNSPTLLLLLISLSEVYRICCAGGRTVCLPYANASAAVADLLLRSTQDITTLIT